MIGDASCESWDLTSPESRTLPGGENIPGSSWYVGCLDARVARDARQAYQAIENLTCFYTTENNGEAVERPGTEGRLAEVRT